MSTAELVCHVSPCGGRGQRKSSHRFKVVPLVGLMMRRACWFTPCAFGFFFFFFFLLSSPSHSHPKVRPCAANKLT